MSNNGTVWKQVIEKIETKLSKPSFETWIKATTLYNVDEANNLLTIQCENEFARDWLESRYKSLFENTLFEVTNQKYRLIFISDDSNANIIQKDRSISAKSTDEQFLTAISELNKINLPKNNADLDVIKEIFKQIIENQQKTNKLLEQLLKK